MDQLPVGDLGQSVNLSRSQVNIFAFNTLFSTPPLISPKTALLSERLNHVEPLRKKLILLGIQRDFQENAFVPRFPKAIPSTFQSLVKGQEWARGDLLVTY